MYLKLVTSDLFFQSLQSDLEAEQVKVNSLTHMVVIVDESSGESATAVLEEQLQVKMLDLSSSYSSRHLKPLHVTVNQLFLCLKTIYPRNNLK